MPVDKKTLLSAAALVAALAAGFGLAKFTDRAAEKPAEAEHEPAHAEAGDGFVRLPPAQAAAAGVAVVSVTRGGAGDLRLTGRVEAAPTARATVAAPVAGAVERLLVAPGVRVAQGAGLALIRSADGASLAAEARAAAADVEAARAALAREERLFRAGVTARQDWEAARATAARAEAQAGSARARAAAAGAPATSGLIVVRSPIVGVVTALQVAPGGFVGEGGAVATVADPAAVEVVFQAPAEAAAKLSIGAPLKVIGPDGGEGDAQIVGIAPLAQDATGAAVVRATPRGGRLTPGAAVSAAIATEAGGLPIVPAEAVQTLNGRPVVFVAEAGGFRARAVTPGRTGAGVTQIVAGLSGAERIAGRGAFVLKAELSKSDAGHAGH